MIAAALTGLREEAALAVGWLHGWPIRQRQIVGPKGGSVTVKTAPRLVPS
jgi:hypothetical protein